MNILFHVKINKCKCTLKISDIRSFKRRLTQSSVSCELGKTCNECETPAAWKQINTCKYEEKCMRESSTAPCDYTVPPLGKTRQSATLLYSGSEEDSDSDDVFCECCTCGCEDSSIWLISENLSIWLISQQLYHT